jgi:hypothetical protein
MRRGGVVKGKDEERENCREKRKVAVNAVLCPRLQWLMWLISAGLASYVNVTC